MIKHNQFLAKQRIENGTDQLMYKCKHGNDTREYRKQ